MNTARFGLRAESGSDVAAGEDERESLGEVGRFGIVGRWGD
jgi:hypothetical protein